ncbi:hypothetical protein [Halomarina rubra]|uniref:Uncharacterized protein n=1 Tax=Halomarina rubra TaxID=2071873 RepID=A0ABD6AXG5_9EURY|nr:hypothetical protein [Halomarina rubra]
MTTILNKNRPELRNWTVERRQVLFAKLTLAVGFFALAAGMWSAYQNPANGYELSIYAETPIAFWVTLVFALFVSAGLSLHPGLSPTLRTASVGLGVMVGMALVGLPLLRGYYFFGSGDSLTHLGWVKDIIAGRLDPLEFMYPASHLVAIFIGESAGISSRQAVMLMVFVYAIVPFIFVPMCMRQFTDRLWTIPVGLFCALMLLPVNNISVHLMSHPTTQAILLLPFVLYLLFRYMRLPVADEKPWARASAWGVALAFTTVGFVFVHPQQGVSLLLLFLTISTVGLVLTRLAPDHIARNHNPLYAQTLLLGALVLYWLPRHVRATGAFEAVISRLLTGRATPGDDIAHQSTSLLQVGGSIEELFIKIFLITAVMMVFAAAFVALSMRDWQLTSANDEAFSQYIAAAAFPLGALFLLYFLSGVTRQHYRQIGLIVMLVTVLGGVAIVYGADRLTQRFSTQTVAVGIGAVLVLFVLLSVPVYFASPYIYQPTQDVSQTELQGYDFAVSHGADYRYVGIRNGPGRSFDGLYGQIGGAAEDAPLRGSQVPTEVFNRGQLAQYYGDSRYLIVTTADIAREEGLWNGLRYTADGFESLDRQPGVNLVYSNGEVRSFLIAESATESSTERARETTQRSQTVRGSHSMG